MPAESKQMEQDMKHTLFIYHVRRQLWVGMIALMLSVAPFATMPVQAQSADSIPALDVLDEDTTFFYEGEDEDSVVVASGTLDDTFPDFTEQLLKDLEWTDSVLGKVALAIVGIFVVVIAFVVLLFMFLIFTFPIWIIALIIWLIVRDRRKAAASDKPTAPQAASGSDPSQAVAPFSNPDHPMAQFRFCPKCGSPRFVDHNGKSKHCEACGFTYYLNPSAATVALIEHEGRWLCVRRAKEPAKGTLDLPGGFSDMDETSEGGVVREVKEETGLTVDRSEFLFSVPNRYVYSGFTVPTIDMFYRCHVSDLAPFAMAHAADDAGEILWLRPSDIHPEDFGLTSIRQGVEKLLSMEAERV